MNKGVDRKFLSLMIVFFVAFVLFFTATTFSDRIATFTRAKEESNPSATDSLMFYWPPTAPADGKTAVQINVFVRNSKKLPLASKKVDLNTSLGIVLLATATTDSSGKATFSLTSKVPGVANITALVDNQVELTQKISVKFN